MERIASVRMEAKSHRVARSRMDVHSGSDFAVDSPYDGGYKTHKNLSKSMAKIPEKCTGFSSDDPSAAPIGSGRLNRSLNTGECLINVDLKTLNRVFST